MTRPISALYIVAALASYSAIASQPGDRRLAVCRDREQGVSSLQSSAGNAEVAEPCRQALNEGMQVCVREHGNLRRVTEAGSLDTANEANRARAQGADLSGPVRAMRASFVEARRQTQELTDRCNQKRDAAMQRCRAEHGRLTQERQEMMNREDALRLEAQNVVRTLNQTKRADPNADVSQLQARLQAIAPERAQLAGQIPQLFSQIQSTEAGFQAANTTLGQSVLCLAHQVTVYDEGIADQDQQLAIMAGETPPSVPEPPSRQVATNSERLEQIQRDIRDNAVGAVGRAAVGQVVGLVAKKAGGIAAELVFPPSLEAPSYHPDVVRQADRYIKWSTFSVSTPEGAAANEAAIKSLERK